MLLGKRGVIVAVLEKSETKCLEIEKLKRISKLSQNRWNS